MLKPDIVRPLPALLSQPPSGGCVLKLFHVAYFLIRYHQPPSGGCVLKPIIIPHITIKNQPPSGGCVLKPVPTVDVG